MEELESYKEEVNASLTSADDGNSEVLEIILESLSNNAFMFIFLGCVIIIVIIYSRLKKRRK